MEAEKYNISKESLEYMHDHLNGNGGTYTRPLSKIRNCKFNCWRDVEDLTRLLERLIEFKLEYIKPKDSGFISAVAAICKTQGSSRFGIDALFLEDKMSANSLFHLLKVLELCLTCSLFSDLPDTVKKVISALDLLGNDLKNLLKGNKND